MRPTLYRDGGRLELHSVTCSVCGNDFDAWCSWEPQLGGWHSDDDGCPHCEEQISEEG